MTEIEPVLRYYPPDCRPSRTEPLGSAGGMSGAQFWRITAPRGTLVLRRWPPEHPTPERLSFIHAVLNHAVQRGITFLPLPIRTTTGESFIQYAGHLWEFAPWMPGTADFDCSPSVEKLKAALRALAQFHIATIDFATNATTALGVGRQAETLSTRDLPATQRHLTRLQRLTHREIDELSRAISATTFPELAPLARQFVAVLPRAVPKAIAQLDPIATVPLPLQPCLRDIWHDHVLFSGNKVTGFIDFGAIDIDTPATDIARLLGSLVPIPPPRIGEGLGEGHFDYNIWSKGLAAYSAVRPFSQQESLAVFALDSSGTILAGCNWIRWIYVDRRRFEDHQLVVQRFRRLLSRRLFEVEQ